MTAVRERFYALKREGEDITPEEQNKQQLSESIMNWDYEKFDAFLPLVDVNDIKTKPQRSLLSIACQVEEPQFVAKLLSRGANINLQDKLNRTVLMECCLKGNVKMVRLLLEHDQKPSKNIQDINGYTALYCASQKGHLEIVKLLLLLTDDKVSTEPCNANLQNKEGKSALFVAIDNNHVEVAQYLLENTDCDVECTAQSGVTILMRACSKGLTSVVELLLAHKPPPNINRVEPAQQRTCLMMAAHKQYSPICHLLLEHQNPPCELWLLASDERSALDIANKRIDPKLVNSMRTKLHNMIIEAVADINAEIPIDVIKMVTKWAY